MSSISAVSDDMRLKRSIVSPSPNSDIIFRCVRSRSLRVPANSATEHIATSPCSDTLPL